MKELKISVRSFVEFLLRSGDLKSGGSLRTKEAMLEGGRIHRKLQKRMGSTYRSEVSLTFRKEYEDFALTVWGRADGIYRSRGIYVIDEIKGTYNDIDKMEEPVPVHMAQASCYAYLFALSENKEKVRIQVRYCHLVTERIRKFSVDRTFQELEEFFEDLLRKYYRWAEFLAGWSDIRNASIKGMEFPFSYRDGQQSLTADVYRTILRKKQIFIQAATGTGKTMSVVFPSVHALGEGLADKVFYLTAKTVTGTVALEAADILREKGLRLKSVFMTAKEKICPYDETDCDPAKCERACGHYDRVNDTLYDLLNAYDSFTRERISEKAREGCVCPFELQLDLALFADMMIGDYNYAFDPEARLKRFFAANAAKTEAVFLIDEAHNLVARAREMFSARISKQDVLAVRKLVKTRNKKLYSALTRINSVLLEIKKEQQDESIKEIAFSDRLEFALLSASSAAEDYLEEETEDTCRKDVLSLYFEMRHFLGICERFGEDYIVYAASGADPSFTVCLSCVNPAASLNEVLATGRSAAFFSATMLPIKYYQDLLSREEAYAVYVPSPFSKKNRKILYASDVSSRYRSRNESMYKRIASYIRILTEGRRGRYLVYFPSYKMMEDVSEHFLQEKDGGLNVLLQNQRMTEEEREEFLNSFSEEKEEWLVGFCVLGGIFSEGIDLTGERLIGTAIVGTGLPMVTRETDLLMNYYEKHGQNGFDHAYRYPGMNKVLQAAGRVIRTAEDRGVILLLDDRLGKKEYRDLFPREWSDIEKCTLSDAAEKIDAFWKKTDKAN